LPQFGQVSVTDRTSKILILWDGRAGAKGIIF
jgi:hypothetical protein